MKPRIYVETSVISYLTAWPSRDPIRAADQLVTREWWEKRREGYDVFVSEIVLTEIGAGDPIAASERLAAIGDITTLRLNPDSVRLAGELTTRGPLPKKAEVDAFHIAIAAAEGMNYLLTWNCVHIANAAFRRTIEEIILSWGFQPPVICTPRDLPEPD